MTEYDACIARAIAALAASEGCSARITPKHTPGAGAVEMIAKSQKPASRRHFCAHEGETVVEFSNGRG